MEANRPNTPSDNNLNAVLRRVEMQQANLALEVQFQKNMAFFKERNPDLYQRYIDYTPTELKLLFTESGYTNLVNYNLDNKPVYPEDPEVYARKYVEQYIKKPIYYRITAKTQKVIEGDKDAHIRNMNPLIDEILASEGGAADGPIAPYTNFLLMLGVGFGYQITQLLQHSDIHHLVILEPHEDIFYASLHTLDWQAIYQHFGRPHYSLRYIVGKSSRECYDQLLGHLHRIGIHNVIKPFVFEHLRSKEIKETAKVFFDRVPSIVTSMGYFDDEQISLAHTVANYRKNTPILRQHPLIDKTFVDYPALLIANGPSLDKAVDFLRENQGKAIIISCGTALGSLYKMGIKPDFHIEMERTQPIVEWIESSTDAEYRRDIILLALNTVHPGVYDLFPSRGMGMKNNDLGSHFISQFIGKGYHVINLSHCNPTVANAGLAFSAALGFKEIYLIGADLGFSDGDKHHSSLSAHYDVKDEHTEDLNLYKIDREGNVKLPGNFGGEIISTSVYNSARQTMETLLILNSEVKCYNTSHGVLIEGTQPLALADIKLDQAIADKTECVREIFTQCFHRRGLKQIANDNIVLQQFSFSGKLFKAFIDTLQGDAQSISGAFAILDKHHQICLETGLNKSSQYFYTLMKGSISSFGLALAKCLYTCATDQESLALFNRCKDFYLTFLQDARQKMQDNLLGLDGRRRNLDKIMKT